MSNREVLFLIVYALFASQFIDSDDMMDLINSQPAPSLTAENPNPHISIADQHQNIQDILENFYTHFPRLQSQLRSDQPRIKDEDTDLLILAHDILSAEIEFQNSERKGTPDASFEDLRKLHQSIQNMLNLIQSGDNLVYSLVTNSEIFIRNWQQRRLTPERRQLAQQFKEFAPLTRQRILRETASNQTPDAAISEEVGGIDLNQNYMEMEESGEKASFNIPVHLQHIQPQSVIGIIPVIKHIAPIPSLYPLLGLVDPRTGEEPKQLYSKDPEPFEQLTAL